MNETGHEDVRETKAEIPEILKNIKPEREMTVKELNDAVRSEFNKAALEAAGTGTMEKHFIGESVDKNPEKAGESAGETVNKTPENTGQSAGEIRNGNPEKSGQKEYRDDNGKLFRTGDKVLPNNEFTENGYTYKTDEFGRLKSAGGRLHLSEPGYKRNMENVKKIEGQEYKPTDDRGHGIAHQFGGSDRLENLVPMEAGLNRGDFAKFENTLASAVKDGAVVMYKFEPVYSGNSSRPSEFRVSYSIDGDRDVVVFKNGSEAKS